MASTTKNVKSESESSSLSGSEDSEGEWEQSLERPVVVDKYTAAAKIANQALRAVLAQADIPGTKVYDLCVLGDAVMRHGLANVFTTKKKTDTDFTKGIAFPTCVSINDVCGHYSPSDADLSGKKARVGVVRPGDVVKVDLGVHIDGMLAVAGDTVVARQLIESPASPADDNSKAAAAVETTFLDGPVDVAQLKSYNAAQQPITGKAAQVVAAAHYAAEIVHRMIKPGTTNTEITAAIQKVADVFGVQPVEGVLSHRMKRFIIDSSDVINNKNIEDKTVDEFTIEAGSVFGVDIVMSSGEGKPRELGDFDTSVYKRQMENNYSLKRKTSRQVFTVVNKEFQTMPFAVRNVSVAPGVTGDHQAIFDAAVAEKDISKLSAEQLKALAGGNLPLVNARAGLVEMARNELVAPYPVMHEKPTEVVAQVKFTVLVLSSQTMRTTGPTISLAGDKIVEDAVRLPFPSVVATGNVMDDAELKNLMNMSTRRNKKKKKSKKKGGAATTA